MEPFCQRGGVDSESRPDGAALHAGIVLVEPALIGIGADCLFGLEENETLCLLLFPFSNIYIEGMEAFLEA